MDSESNDLIGDRDWSSKAFGQVQVLARKVADGVSVSTEQPFVRTLHILSRTTSPAVPEPTPQLAGKLSIGLVVHVFVVEVEIGIWVDRVG